MRDPHEQIAVYLRALRRRRAQILDPPLKLRDALQGVVPACLQFTGDMSLGGINQFVAPCSQSCFIACSLQITFDSGDHRIAGRFLLFRGDDGSLDSVTRDCLKTLQRYCPVDTHTADTNAKPGADMAIIAPALVAVRIPFAHAIEDAHHPPAVATTHEAAEERSPTAPRFACAVFLHIGILQQQTLVLLVLLPTDVSGMVVL